MDSKEMAKAKINPKHVSISKAKLMKNFLIEKDVRICLPLQA